MSDLLNRRSKKAILEILSHDQKWSSDILIDLLLLHGLKSSGNIEEEEVQWIDPSFFSMVVTGSEKHRHYKKNFTILRDKFQKNPPNTLLIPIYNNMHWSLLVYRHQSASWYFCDSLFPYHNEHAKTVLLNLCKRGIIIDKNYTVVFYDKLQHQHYDFECGLYVLMYALIFSLAHEKIGDSYLAHLDKELIHINNKIRIAYKNNLIEIMKENGDEY